MGMTQAGLALLVAYLVGAVPFAQLAARLTRGADLRLVGTGTVSGTGLYRVAGFWPLAIAGVLDVGKGAAGPLLAARSPTLAALAGGAAVAGHNWSPFLRWAGGRGISPAMGALAVTAWPGAVLLLAGLAIGRLARQTGAVCFVADLALVPLATMTRGSAGALAAAAVLIPMLVKRLAGNRAPAERTAATYLRRLVFDRDEPPGQLTPRRPR